jgi:2-amino-4-hydroxy-6-hydroxymethyldihydropteridine diphosphokinase
MILVALGANLPSPAGPPVVTLAQALKALEGKGVMPVAVSSFYETPAWPNPADPPFVNAVAELRTGLQPLALMELLHTVETDFGRKRSAPNAPRTLDLDLLDYDGLIWQGPLLLPHPRLAERAFVLAPLVDIAPDWRHPVTGRTARVLLAALPEGHAVRRLA